MIVDHFGIRPAPRKIEATTQLSQPSKDGRGTSTPRNGRLPPDVRPELQLSSGPRLGPPSRLTLSQQDG